MSTEAETSTTPEGEDKDPKWYRDEIDRRDEKIKELEKENNRNRVRLLEKTFEALELDPTKGLGKAIAEKYEGEPDVDALRTFAIEEYQWEPPTQTPAQSVNEAQARVSGAVNEAESAPTQEIDLQIAQAEEKGDFASAVSLKVQKFRQEQGI